MTTMIAYLPTSTTRLGVGFDTNRRSSPNREAWKKAIGTKSISARLELLPGTTLRWDRMGVSASVQIAVLLFFLLIPLFYPDKIKAALNLQIVPLASPIIEVLTAPPPLMIKPRVQPPTPEGVEPVQLNPMQPRLFMKP